MNPFPPSPAENLEKSTSTSSRRLVFYSYDYEKNPWCGGGGAYRDLEVLRQQNENWKSITLIVGNFPGFKKDKIAGIQVRSLGCKASHLISRISFSFLSNVHLLFNRADVIGNSISVHSPIFTGLFFPFKFYGVIHHLVGTQSFEKFGALGWIPYISEKIIFKNIRHVISSNKSVARQIRKMNPSVDVLVSANGFEPALLKLIPTSSTPPFILFLGRFDVYMKGLDILLTAFKKLIAEGCGNVNLVLAGRASEKKLKEIEKLVSKEGLDNRTEIMPNISTEKKKELLRSCIFFCSPSRFEGWGIAALEANACGKTVIVTETEGFLDSIKRDYSGIFVPVNDPEGLAGAMRQLITDDALRLKLGENGKKWSSGFSWKTIGRNEYEWVQTNFLIVKKPE